MSDTAQLDPNVPPHADVALWPDPEDSERPPRHVRGYRRGDVLGWLRRRGNQEISRAHILAAREFRHHFDVARYGLSGSGRDVSVRIQPAPRTSPLRSDVLRQASLREVGRVYGAVGEAAWPLLLWVVVLDRDVRAWCDDAAMRVGVRPDERKAFGRLLAVLDRLAEHFGTHRLVQKEARR
jgi:hypothetical protein